MADIVRTHVRSLGDTLAPIGAKLLEDNGSPVDLAGATVTFFMLDAEGAEKVAETAATIVDAGEGLVQYEPAAEDVDTAGKFFAYFREYRGGEARNTYPREARTFAVVLSAP